MKTNSKKYVDGFVIPIKKKDLAAYKKMAEWGARMWKKNGALEYFECVGNDLKVKKGCHRKVLLSLRILRLMRLLFSPGLYINLVLTEIK